MHTPLWPVVSQHAELQDLWVHTNATSVHCQIVWQDKYNLTILTVYATCVRRYDTRKSNMKKKSCLV